MLTTFAAPLGSLTIEPLAECEYSADGLQNGWPEVLALGEPVNEIECHRRSLKPLSTIINRPNAVGLRKLIHECLNKRI